MDRRSPFRDREHGHAGGMGGSRGMFTLVAKRTPRCDCPRETMQRASSVCGQAARSPLIPRSPSRGTREPPEERQRARLLSQRHLSQSGLSRASLPRRERAQPHSPIPLPRSLPQSKKTMSGERGRPGLSCCIPERLERAMRIERATLTLARLRCEAWQRAPQQRDCESPTGRESRRTTPITS